MGGACISCNSARVRIKGRWQSVIRFFFIAVGFMMAWVLVSSELAYYSKWFGPQILLQLNFAFYLPSIPVLIISGQFEKCLDSRVGPTASMMVRLNIGLAGSAALCAAFPFITKTHSGLLTIVAILGTLSAIAFSTSYQLVQWFRHADIIGLGIGAVGSGPLVLIIQLGLVQLQTWPQRWQWIAQFEICACIILVGLLSSLSLFGQYWNILTGAEQYEDIRKPLLSELGDGAEDGSSKVAQGSPALGQAKTSGGNWYFSVEVVDAEEQEAEQRLALRLAPAGHIILAPDPFHGGMLPVVFRDPSEGMVSPSNGDAPLLESLQTASHASDPVSPPSSQSWAQGKGFRAGAAGRTVLSEPRGVGQTDHSPFAKPDAQKAAPASLVPPVALGSGSEQDAENPRSVNGASAEANEERPAMTLTQESLETLRLIWPVMTSFFMSVTLMYLIFPFFTYIPTNGLLGDTLPRVLFFTRIGADLVGRFSPRVKALVTQSPQRLFTLAATQLLLAILLILYIKAPSEFHNDILPVGAVIFLWSAAGYVNTCCNMLAPAIVPDYLCPRASALMALMFQIAHFAGLVLAALLVYLLFGDIAG